MSSAPKFLLNGINMKQNFLGVGTMKTAVYGVIETGIKAAPIFAFIYGVSKLQIVLYNPIREVLFLPYK